jgi:signal transduction histidine kinase
MPILKISVSDNGTGIDPASGYIFDPYFTPKVP